MKVIGAGFGRTGTFSLKAALEQIGYGPCYHMFEVIQNPGHVPAWLAGVRDENDEWLRLLDGYESTTDWPGCTFWRELARAYPEAKVLLNTRDPEKWYESVQATFLEARRKGMAEANDLEDPRVAMVVELMAKTFPKGIEDHDHAIEVFHQHYQAVQDDIPADRLLVYNVTEGWEPLCEFLGVPVPDEPFPRLNDRETFMREAPNKFVER